MSTLCIAPNGADFGLNNWDWRPLSIYCFDVYQPLQRAADARHWAEGSGGKMTADEAHALARVLRREIASGRTLQYLQARTRRIEAMPDVPCRWCEGGTRYHTPLTVSMNEVFQGHPSSIRVGDPFECNVCGGLGTVRPDEDKYRFDIQNVRNFADFLRRCDGFEVT